MDRGSAYPTFTELGFEHLGFAHARVLCNSPIGAPVHKRIPYGMPVLHKENSDSVFFLFARDPEDPKALLGPLGTGTVISRKSKDLPGFEHFYGVTNWHVALEAGASIIRINTRDGGTRLLDFDPLDWSFSKVDDVAAIDLTDELKQTDQIAVRMENGFLDERAIRVLEIGPGEDVFMIGLFANHHGGKRNIPTVRFGNLSMLATDQAPVRVARRLLRPAHLVDMRSRTGYSGSPVILYRIPTNDISSLHLIDATSDPQPVTDLQKERHRLMHNYIGMLGIHSGQFKEPVAAYKSEEEAAGSLIRKGDELYIPSSMTIVVPAWRISQLLDEPEFEALRQAREQKNRAAWMKHAQSESVAVPPTTDENPHAREDFTSLLAKAARTPPQDG